MSITLKNITAADTISSMVDKINFNFDQLLINGGGIEGPRGVEGYPGMQGKQGERGSIGPEGKQGARGVHFHILSIDDVEYARTWGLTEYDPYGDEYQDGDMIIAYRSEYSDSTEYNYTDSIWRVEYQEDGPQGQKCYPVPAINEVSSSSTKNLSFAMTTFFTEFGISGQSTETSNKLLRTKKEDYKRGLVLNDYNENLDASNISQDIIDSIVNNNISLVYTEPLGENDEGSPNCGIVFYKKITNISSTTQIGDYPRINYVYSPDGTINYFNICAKEQGITLFAKNNININSNEGNLILNTTSKSCSINVQRNGIDFIVLKSTDPLDEYSPSELHIGADEIYIEKKSDDNNNAISLVSFKNESYIGHSDVCEIKLHKNENYIKLNDDNIFTIGKSGLEFRNSNDIDDDTYFNQSRITIINETNKPHIDLITPELYIGRDPSYYDYKENYGMYLSKEKTSILTTKIDDNDNTKFYKSDIILSAENPYRSTIILNTTYPGVVNIANVSETYSDSIINYPHSSMFANDEYTDRYNNVAFCTSPMSDAILKNNRYNYANMNCYYNMAIRHVKNMGAVHAGTISFNGKYENAVGTTVYDYLVYNFIRIGSTVHCKVSGKINLNKISARRNSTPSIVRNYITETNEVYCKSNDSAVVTWPANTSSQKYPSNASSTSKYGMIVKTENEYEKRSYANNYVDAAIMKVSLNKLYLNLFPPVVRIEYDHTNDRYIANVTDFIGHLTYTSAGNTYEKQLEYNNDLLISTGTVNNRCYKIRAIAVRDMENSSSSDINSSYNWDGLNQGNSALVLNGTTSQNIIEINAEFSYKIRTEYDDLFQHRNEPINLGSTNV